MGGSEARDGGRLGRWVWNCRQPLSVEPVASVSYPVQNQAVSVRIRLGDRKHAYELNGEKLSGRTRPELAHRLGSASGTLRRKQQRG